MSTILYRYFDNQDQLLYVGITGDNVKRQSQHRRNSFWFGKIAVAKFEHFKTRDEALQAEAAAIRLEKPLHNIAGTGNKLGQSPYTHMIFLAGMPDEGHDETHKLFCQEYKKHFSAANGHLPEANMVIALAMQFTKVNIENAPNLKKCSLCIEAYKSEWFTEAFKALKRWKR